MSLATGREKSYYILMENVKNKKRGPAAIFMLCPARHVLLLLSALVIIAHLATRGNRAFIMSVSQNIIRPAHFAMTRFFGNVSFSAAEVIIACAAFAVISFLGVNIYRLIKLEEKLRQLYRMFITLAAAGLFVYAGFCMLWGVYYYGDDFITESGFERGEISTQELCAVTRYFADAANEYSALVPRDENGLYCTPRRDILDRSAHIYDSAELLFPCLEGPDVCAKGIHFSRIMSYTDFTGFFFPFTAEANVNTDFPLPLFASTVAHELAHLRGVAKEQEANFVAVLASFESGDADYIYSAALLAYVHLGNALHSADYEAWQDVYGSLNDTVRADLILGNTYWKQFETPVQTVSNTVYEGFLQSYDQKLGLKSYGACVDLLVNYYIDKIS